MYDTSFLKLAVNRRIVVHTNVPKCYSASNASILVMGRTMLEV